MDALRLDIRHALRRLARSPGFTIVALLTLALGIGANTAIFTIVNAVILKPLPYDRPEQLVGVFHQRRGKSELSTMSPPNFLDVRAQNRTLTDMAAINTGGYTITGTGAPVRVEGAEVSASFFDVLHAKPMLGRGFRVEENEPGRHRVVVLSHSLWRQRFGGASDVIGRTVAIEGAPHTIIGVTAAGFSYPENRALWVPFQYDQDFRVDNRGAWYVDVIGRLKPGLSIADAARDVDAIARRLARQYPKSNTDLGMTVAPLHGWIVGDTRMSLLLLLGAVGFVLLIACVNVANLMLARAAAREGELAVRAALGAGRGRLIRQLLTESVILSMAGGICGVLLAWWGSDALVNLQPEGIPRLGEVRVDTTVAAFAAAVSMLTGLLFGSIPAIQMTREVLVGALKEGGRGAMTGRRSLRVRGGLVIAELALAVALLAGAGLLINSFVRVQRVHPGFATDQALTFRVSLPDTTYPDYSRRIVFFDRLLTRLTALPGVRSAGAIIGLPLSNLHFNISFNVDGRPEAPPGQEPSMEVRVASPDYFRTLGIPLKRGRLFTKSDVMGAPQVALLSESAAQRYFPNEDPLGRTVTLGWHFDDDKQAGGQVVGIVGDVKDAGLDEPSPPEIYIPHAQIGIGWMALVVRGAIAPSAFSKSVETVLRELDPDLPIADLKTLDEIRTASVSGRRFYVLLLTLFAAVALTLAAVGIFGVMSYAVTQQTREIGIRMALGADRDRVVWMILRRACLLVLAGLIIGLAMAIVTGRALASLLYELSPTDPVTLAAVCALLAGIALLASYLPARRATRIDPVVALRAE
jgi:putative ABC transport system permease protein